MPQSTDRRILAGLVKHAQAEEDDPLTPLIEDYLIKRVDPRYAHLRIRRLEIETDERPRPPGRISPSMAGGCARQAVFVFTGTKGRRKVDPDQEMIFEDGKWRHHKWDFIFLEMERFFPKKFKVVSIEESVTIDGQYIAGSLDAIIKIKVNGKWRTYVVDFKGANSFAFEDAYRNKRPNPRYVLQLITYMKSKRKKRGILLFESKDKNRYYCFPVRASDAKWADVKIWSQTVIDAMEARKLPPKDPECNNGKFLYGKCPFKDHCFGKRDAAQVRREVYVNFPGVQEQWDRGNEIIAEWRNAQAS